MKINDTIYVKFIGESDPLMLLNGKIYRARVLKKGWYGIVDETKEEYAYPPEQFEIVSDQNAIEVFKQAEGSKDLKRFAV